ncbi:potassium transporter Kup [Gemmobacter sp.]|uniref:potassium transporter Kup n=1 Tax=Gemmobacter sp. TaxID=1898957 RepID=UPI002AFE191C|nr:potassium transporter Kup [Gemmobacter sp.]
MTQTETLGLNGARTRHFVPDDDELDIADYLRDEAEPPPPDLKRQGMIALIVGAVGVVYGDIGTSPLYAFRETLHHMSGDGVDRAEVLGLLSLLIWTLVLIVTVKYVLVLLRADNRGEGGVLALYTLVRLAIGRRSIPILALAVGGAALFAGDAAITPAISVLSAVEGLALVWPGAQDMVLPVAAVILTALFALQSRGTGQMAVAFGPITLVWFLMLAGLGLMQVAAAPEVLAAFNPVWAFRLIDTHIGIAFLVMGSVFLAVTGAEALYADLGHFGRRPIVIAWVALVFPALVLNYLGQGALVLSQPETLADPFFHMAPDRFLPVLVVIATLATVIASQAVISGAFSMARAAIQLGLLPRMRIRHTAHDQSGQIYIGAVNWMLMAGVLWLVLAFQSSGALASAYGIAVTGTMLITSALAVLYVIRSGRLGMPVALLLAAPIVALELVFLASNLLKIADGGYIPAAIAAVLMVIMAAWWTGTQTLLAKAHRERIDVTGFARSMQDSSAHVVPGTAIFLTPDPDAVPSALLHNLKHNRVLHEQTVLLTVETLRVPFARAEERVSLERLPGRFARVTLRFGFMETPNVSRAMASVRRAGLKFDVMATSFFLGRRHPVVTRGKGGLRLAERLYVLLSRFSADPTAYYHLPRNRVVELGERVTF